MGRSPTIHQIEARRSARAVTIGALLRVAGLPRSPYSRLRRNPQSGRAETLRKLELALSEIISMQEQRS